MNKSPNEMPIGTILEHVSLHSDEVMFFEKVENNKWNEIEKWNPEAKRWEICSNFFLYEPVDDDPSFKVGWYCVYHGVREGW